MYAQVLITFHPITTILILSLIIPTHYAQSDSEKYNSCHKTTTSACGKPIGIIEYPFWGENIRPPYCGLERFKLSCENSDAVVDIGYDSKYRVVEINPSTSVLKLNYFDNPLMEICASRPIDSSTLNELYNYGQNTEDLHFYYNCDAKTDTTWIQSKFSCSGDDDNQVYFFGKDTWSADLDYKLVSCHHTSLPVNTTVVLEEFIKNVENAILQRQPFNVSFEVQYNKTYGKACLDCVKSGGLCWQGTNIINNNTCLYSDGTVHSPYPGKSKKLGLKIGIASGVVVGSMLLLLVLFVLFRRKKNKRGSSVVSRNVSRNVSSYSFSMSDSEKGSDPYMGVATFSYNELEKATNNFDSSNELGDGGFGTVYKGKLQDGREVAVKRLYENNYKRVEQFMNEIVILTKLRHPNLVVLYGSTSSQCRKLLLVYEYIPNGTIADHLYGDDAEPGNLAWKTRMSIAVETASALSYLHKTEVIHRDVKTTNILLDNNFHVKVADFGLSRLFPMNVTHVSTAPQGTPGYVDPEYHQCYQLTVKSDVYSFGVVLIELISSKPAVDITRHRHEINLANLAINKIQGNALDELVDPSLGFESDYNIKNMITEVAELAFRCLQNERESRPSMEEVYKSLKETQSKYYGEKNESDDNLLGDDAFLLKNYPQNLSPDSVTAKWVSNLTNSSSSI